MSHHDGTHAGKVPGEILRASEPFEYRKLLVTRLDPNNDVEHWNIISLSYGRQIGRMELDEGSGAVFLAEDGSFLDAGDAYVVSDLLAQINDEWVPCETAQPDEAPTVSDMFGKPLEAGQRVVFPLAQIGELRGLGRGTVVGFIDIAGISRITISSADFTAPIRLSPKYVVIVTDQH